MPLSTIPGHRVSFPAQAVATGNAANQPSFVSSPKSSVPLCANNANLRNLVPKGQKEMLVVFKELELVMSLGQANLSESDDSSDTEASFQVTLWCQMQLVICLYSAGLLEWRHWLLFVIYILVSTMSSIAMEQTTWRLPPMCQKTGFLSSPVFTGSWDHLHCEMEKDCQSIHWVLIWNMLITYIQTSQRPHLRISGALSVPRLLFRMAEASSNSASSFPWMKIKFFAPM